VSCLSIIAGLILMLAGIMLMIWPAQYIEYEKRRLKWMFGIQLAPVSAMDIAFARFRACGLFIFGLVLIIASI